MSLRDVIEKKLRGLEAKIKAKDYEGICSFYTENLALMPSTGETIIGQKDLLAFCNKAYSPANIEHCGTLLDVFGDDNLVYARGCYKLYDSGKEIAHGNFVHIWKKVNGDFKLHVDIWN